MADQSTSVEDIVSWAPGLPYDNAGSKTGFEQAAAGAEKDGLRVLVATGYQLFLDLDTPGSIKRFHEMLPVIMEFFKVTDWSATFSKSYNFHVIMQLADPLPESDRIALQSILGSDPKKEMSAIRRRANGMVNVVRLFQPVPAMSAVDTLIELAK